jgi:hypothetical protein
MATHDVLVLGHGLSGAVLCEVLLERGLRVCCADGALPGSASAVAAGLVNPIAIRRTIPVWRAAETHALAEAFYRRVEKRYQRALWHPLPLARLFTHADEAVHWQAQMAQPDTTSWLSRTTLADVEAAPVHKPFGYGVVHGAAWLDVPAFLSEQATRMRAEKSLIERVLQPEELVPQGGLFRWPEASAPLLVRCQGAHARLPGLVPVRGEVISVHLPHLQLQSALHRGAFLLPQQAPGYYRVGATFGWEDVWQGPNAIAVAALLERTQRMAQQATEPEDGMLRLAEWGVRPASFDRRPLLGQRAHPCGAREAVMNGMGARGVLLAPWCAWHLVEHLFASGKLNAEVDLARTIAA